MVLQYALEEHKLHNSHIHVARVGICVISKWRYWLALGCM